MPEFVSLGENCLPDDILSFVGKKNESYPFGSGRFNIEYIIEVLDSDFRDLLDPKFLEIGTTDKKRVVRNTCVGHSYDIYSETVTMGFEFTHHYVLEEVPKKSFERKIKRFQKALAEKKDLVFIYHYRYNPKMDVGIITELLVKFLDLLENKYGKRFKCIMWYQNIQPTFRKLEITKSKDILVTEFFSNEEWEGDDLWNGASDRDLFTLFFADTRFKKYVYGPLYFIEPAKEFLKKVFRRIRKIIS